MFQKITQFFRENKSLTYIILFGLVLRLIFTLVVAPVYFNRANIFVDGDTGAWTRAIQNLIHYGELNFLKPGNDITAYSRMPGYSFFLAPSFLIVTLFYKIQGLDIHNYSAIWDVALKLTAYTQIILDTISIFLVFYIAKRLFSNYKIGIISAFLYATYPFVIVWNPVCYSEIPSIFFALLALALALKGDKKYILAIAGISLGFAVLNRPQYALLAPFVIFLFYQKYKGFTKESAFQALIFYVFFTITYGSWPLRNYIRFGKVVTTQDLSGISNWNQEVIAFMQYVYSVKAEWDPQFSNIIHNKPVKFPPIAYRTPEDSIKLERAIYLSQNCGSGFSYWKGYWKNPIPANDPSNCSAEAAQLFNELRANQIKYNSVNFYITIPLQNLKKALFKSELSDSKSLVQKLGGMLFYYRTFLLMLGIIGLVMMLRDRFTIPIAMLIGSFFVALYFYLSFGTSPQCRNIEMRYLLQPDVLMLLPAAFLLSKLRFLDTFLNKFTSTVSTSK
ncbi:MAG: glycosyltransferase family 39 protein [Chitinophagales bacterium]|nr:glycosyltransferase family 39 protein [Chitinophagales bacterium]OJV25572.1 MAG: hypothetical protein BGO32_00745 [Bacteroidetes bacterium 37-13]HRN93669.1 glycosyltransferase family 39 protein [Chitinophagales bacterium]HRP38164.1 glycosyltransferase family 39 protein [Chitinophagales bacterium]